MIWLSNGVPFVTSAGIFLHIHGYLSSSVGEGFWTVVLVVCVKAFNDFLGDEDGPGCFQIIPEMFTLIFCWQRSLPFSFCLPFFPFCRFACYAFRLQWAS